MATKKSQRIAIWVIALIMMIGTIGGFAALMIDPNGEMRQQIESERAAAEYQRQLEEMNKPLEGYEATAFNSDEVTELKVDVLKEGDGVVLDENATISANYFGWTSNGKIFDSTNKYGETSPIEFPLQGVIEGWTEGLSGVKVGSTVRLTIPSEMAYGDDASTGRPTGPLMFIVEVVEKIAEA
ncbi:hypothetical protein B7Y94_05220 [Candidatus Saccharibacteria bacterium 32-49-12]|nr:MAG: hypothetical protein B7Y94_05220 [Candidatus Saccharibacteria bacterium 32-49-12]